MKTQYKILAPLAAIALTACGSEVAKDAKKGASNLIEEAGIIGSWSGECRDSEIANFGARATTAFLRVATIKPLSFSTKLNAKTHLAKLSTKENLNSARTTTFQAPRTS